MKDCCSLEVRSKKMHRVLWIALWINLIVFNGQLFAAIIANSSALLADSIDMIGDVFAYAISIYAFNRGEKWVTKAAFFKSVIIFALACIVVIDISKKIFSSGSVPLPHLMMIFSFIGLIANGFCLWLLTTYKEENFNMKSVWICSRNDILINLSVIVTGILVYFLKSQWPDIIIGLIIATLLLYSAYHIMVAAKKGKSLSRSACSLT